VCGGECVCEREEEVSCKTRGGVRENVCGVCVCACECVGVCERKRGDL